MGYSILILVLIFGLIDLAMVGGNLDIVFLHGAVFLGLNYTT